MEDDFKIIIFTPENKIPGEAEKITQLLQAGAWRVSVRKPSVGMDYIERLLQRIPAPLHPRITLHDHPELCGKYKVGYQVNGRFSGNELPKNTVLSRSCHSIDELKNVDADYVTLSPIFDSISKKGYKSNAELQHYSPDICNCMVIALGGVTPGNVDYLKRVGFGGAAMLGCVWADDNHFNRILKWLRMRNMSMQFITAGNEVETVFNQCRNAIDGGCRWIQLRMKQSDVTDILKAAGEVNKLLMLEGGTLIVDDHVELVGINGICGVHLGQMDMDVRKARYICGEDAIIGLTINNKEHLQKAVGCGADYFGIGPYRYTSTKKVLSDILGTAGYKELDEERRRLGITAPYVAIGGITHKDIQELKATDACGIAVSGAIIKSDDPVAETKRFIYELKNFSMSASD